MPRLLHIFSSRAFGWLAVLFAIVARFIQLIYFFNIRSDGSFQFLATQNLVNGHGLTISQVNASDLSTVEYFHVVQWPPGFSLLATPLYAIFRSYIGVGLALQIIAALLLIFSTRGILKLLDVSSASINLFTILSSIYIYPFYFICCSDAIAISFFFLAFYHCLQALKNNEASITNYLWICVGLFLAACIKYLFIPVVFVVPAFLYLYGKSNNQKKIIQLAVVSFRVVAFAIAVVLFYQKLTGGAATYISEPDRGWYPSNLSHLYPWFPSSFIQVTTLVILQSMVSETSLWNVYRLTHIVALILFIYLFVRKFLQQGFSSLTTRTCFFYLAFFISFTITLLLTSLSLIVAKENISTMPWTYVEEARYYGVILLLVHLALFTLIQFSQNTWLKRSLYVLLILFSVEGLRGLVFTANRIIHINKEEYSWHHELQFQRYADGILRSNKAKFKVQHAVVAGSSYYMNHRVALYSGLPVMYDAAGLNQMPTISSRQPALLLVILHHNKLQQYINFLTEQSAQFAGQFDEFYFYTVYVAAD